MIYNKTTWENSPSTNTPINAQNLNKIEQGITDAANEINTISHIVNVGTEVEEDCRVNFISSRNLFTINSLLPNTALNNNVIFSSNEWDIFVIPVEIGTTYTLSKTSYNGGVLSFNTTFPKINDTVNNAQTLRNISTLTFEAKDNYLCLMIAKSDDKTTIQVEKGSTATTYEPYTQNQIVVDNETFSDTVKVSNEVDGKSRVNFIKSKNLFDKANVLNAYINSGTAQLASDGNFRTVYIKVKPNTTYTIQKILSNRFVLGFSSDTNLTLPKTLNSVWQDNNATQKTITSTLTANYLFICVSKTSEDTVALDNILNSLQVEEGSTATSYEAFIPNQIVVDNETFTDTLKVGTDVDSRSRVNVLYNKNLIPNNDSFELGYYSSTGVWNSPSNENAAFRFIEVEPNTEYNVSVNQTIKNIAISEFDANQTFIQRRQQVNSSSYVLTMGSTTKYIAIVINYNDVQMTQSLVSGLDARVEIGTRLDTPAIYVDNEMLVSKNVYSSNEVVIGEWLGKPLYRKVVEITNPTLDAWTNVNHNISNMDFGRIVDATLTRTIYGTTSYIPIGVSNISAGTLFTCDLQKTIIEYKIAGYTNITKLTAVLEYTKSTD